MLASLREPLSGEESDGSGSWLRHERMTVAMAPSLTRLFLLPNRLSTCPRCSSSASRREPRFASRSWQNSWWKYLRSCHSPRCSGLWNRPWTFQFRRVVGESLVPKVFFPDRVQQLCRHAFLRGCWSRCSIAFPVEVLKVFSQDKVHLRLRTVQLESLKTQMSLFMGFFALFAGEKSATVPPHSRSELPPHSSSWTSAAYALPTVPEIEERRRAGAGGSC